MRPASEKITLITTRVFVYVSVILKYYNYSFLKYKNKDLKIICLPSVVHLVHIMKWVVMWNGSRKMAKVFHTLDS